MIQDTETLEEIQEINEKFYIFENEKKEDRQIRKQLEKLSTKEKLKFKRKIEAQRILEEKKLRESSYKNVL
jgi:hypothetical protein